MEHIKISVEEGMLRMQRLDDRGNAEILIDVDPGTCELQFCMVSEMLAFIDTAKLSLNSQISFKPGTTVNASPCK
jgi:hypothetical protein